MSLSYQRHYDTVSLALARLETNEIVRPRIPTPEIVDESRKLGVDAERDRAELCGAGLDWALVESLDARIGALVHAQALWDTERVAGRDAQNEWRKLVPRARAMLRELKRVYRFAYYGDTAIQKTIDELAGRRNRNDLSQNLLAYAALGKEHPDRLTAVGFDPAQLDEAVALSGRMARVLSSVAAESGYPQARCNRDRAYTYLIQAVHEIRRVGKFVFAANPKRAAKYASSYYRAGRGKRGKRAEAA